MKRRSAIAEQSELALKARATWGGRRVGAGRKAKAGSGVSHLARPAVSRHRPVHVTLKVIPALRTLRTKAKARAVRQAIARGCLTGGFRIVDWSIQRDHIHMVVEADTTRSLSRGMQGVTIRIARSVGGLLGRPGKVFKVFADRYHARVLSTPREVRNARAYVLNNMRRHAAQRGVWVERGMLDPFSSAAWFDGWKDCSEAARDRARHDWDGPAPVAEARCWLMRAGWRRCGLVGIDEVPGVKSRRRR